MADLSGIIPALPQGPTWSDRTMYRGGAPTQGYGFNVSPTPGGPGELGSYGGYIYGQLDPSNIEGSVGNFQYMGPNEQEAYRLYGGYMTPDKIIPGAMTQTVAQSVGPAQFQIGNQVATAGRPGTQRQFTATAAGPAGTQAYEPQTAGFYFGNQFMPGTFGSSTPGQSSPFYAAQPAQAPVNTNLGIATPWTPQQNALLSSRNY